MLAARNQLAVGFTFGAMQCQHRRADIGEIVIIEPVLRQGFDYTIGGQFFDHLLQYALDRQLVQAFGGRVDRGQRLRQRRRIVDIDQLDFRVNHFQFALGQSDLAETTQPVTLFEQFLLAGVEIKESQRDRPGVVGQFGGEHPARTPRATEAHPGVQHLGLDLAALPRLQRAYRGNKGAILVTQRQVEQQVALAVDAELLQFFRDPGADSFQVTQALFRPVFHSIFSLVPVPHPSRRRRPWAARRRRSRRARDRAAGSKSP